MIRLPPLPLIPIVALVAAAGGADAQPPRVTSVFAGSTLRVDADTKLSDIATSLRFAASSAALEPGTTGCAGSFPRGTIARRYRALVSLDMLCADGTSVSVPEVRVRSGARDEKNAFRLIALPGPGGPCPPPIEWNASVRLKGGALRRFLPAGTVPSPEGLPLEVVCGTGGDFAAELEP